jgi:hypothetical protein
VNLVTETGLTMIQNNLKVQKKGNKFKKKKNTNKKHIFCFYNGNKGHYIKECRFKNFNKKGGSFQSECYNPILGYSPKIICFQNKNKKIK